MATAISKARTLTAVTVASDRRRSRGGFGGFGASRTSAPTGDPLAAGPGSPAGLVGTWTRWQTCRELIDVLSRYTRRLAPAAVYARRFHPGAVSLSSTRAAKEPSAVTSLI